jgi:TonB family protein
VGWHAPVAEQAPVIHFDFDDRYQDELVVGSAIPKRDGVLLSTSFHLIVLALILFGPELTFLKPDPSEAKARQQDLLRQRREAGRFVFVQSRVDFEAKQPPPRAELSDINRKSQAPRRADTTSNPLPFSRGDSSERTEPAAEEQRRVETEVAANTEPPQPPEQIAQALPPASTGRETETARPTPGRPGDVLRNLQRYVRNQTFNNPQGGARDPGSAIQFDTKGVEFGPWIRRFVAQVKRNWFIPNAAMSFRGHVVIQFNIHKNGQITDVNVVAPSSIESFNRAAYNAIVGSSPTEPLPPEYPDPTAFFTVTFFYNEQPPG